MKKLLSLNFIKKAFDGIIVGVFFILTVGLFYIVYAATSYYTDLPQVSSGSILSSSSWNNLVNYANKAVKQDSEVLTITGGQVGIGTTTPTSGYKLDVVDAGGAGIRITDTTNFSSLRNQWADATGNITAAKNGTVPTTINFITQTAAGSLTNTLSLTAGKVGVGTTTPTSKIYVGGNLHTSGDGIAIDGVLRLIWGTDVPTPNVANAYIWLDSTDNCIKVKFSSGTAKNIVCP